MVHAKRSNRSTNDRGVTLLELLVVMTIMLMVTAAAIPIMRPAMQNRRTREAARLLTSYISAARTRAIESGRDTGLIFERFNNLPFALNISMAQVPQGNFAGDVPTSAVVFESQTSAKISLLGQVTVYPMDAMHPTPYVAYTGGGQDKNWNNLIRFGDLVKLNNQETPVYILSSQATLPDPKSGDLITVPPTSWYLVNRDRSAPNWPQSWTMNAQSPPAGVPYKIIRQPVRMATAPLELPEGMVIDLLNSGLGDNPLKTTTNPNIDWNPIVMFSPNGAIRSTTFSSDSYDQPLLLRPTTPLYLLLGRRDLMPDVSASGKDENLFEPETMADKAKNLFADNFWIKIGFQTGSITVAENTGAYNLSGTADIVKAREFARNGQSTVGK